MKFLDLDSPFMRFLSRMTDILWLNILTIALCIPVITAGAAFTALHYTCLKMVRDEESYITKDYFKSFKKNFLQATAIWLIFLAVVALLIIDVRCLKYVSYGAFLFAALVAAAVFIGFTALYVFPVLSHFENTIRGTLKNSFFMSILALPRTILTVLLYIAPLVIFYFVETFEAMTWLIPLTFMFCIALPAYYQAKLNDKTFKRFEPETDTSGNDDFSWTVGGEEESLDGENESADVAGIETGDEENRG